MLSGETLKKVVATPPSFEQTCFDAKFGRAFLFLEVERQMSQDDNVLLTMVLTHATGIFSRGGCAGYISYPLRKLRVSLFNSLIFDECYAHEVRLGECSCQRRQERIDQDSNIHLI
jgi:hypothetical protein